MSESAPPRGRLGERDLHWFNEGTHYRLYEKLGAHRETRDGVDGVAFAVWAPSARRVSAVGSFNGWDPRAHPLLPVGESGIWEGFVAGAAEGDPYKFHVRSRIGGYAANKADPFAFRGEVAPRTASIVAALDHDWNDDAWMAERGGRQALDAPISIYEVHLGSWRRRDDGASLSYRELAEQLPAYVQQRGFTHVELLPITEHPFYGSWGYQTTGYFAATSRYGEPRDLMLLIDRLHGAGIGVILDWVPSHFPQDEHGLGFFDGTHLYEHADPRLGFHPDWKSLIFNYARREVRSFLISSAFFWLDRFHIDALRVDAVASMLYLDYSREEGEWVANRYGGRENLEAIEFLRQLNSVVYREFPDVQMIAEESTAWPLVSRPTHLGGLGFGLKWDMGWMHDTLAYMGLDPIARKHHHGKVTFRMLYAGSENFVLPLSHDEVVHGKSSLIGKMSGDIWQKFAHLRLLYGTMYGQTGKKLLFMGSELAPWPEWDHDAELPWHLLEHDAHAGVQRWVDGLNRIYRDERALHAGDCAEDGFEWIDCQDHEQSVLAWIRRVPQDDDDAVVVVANYTPVVREGYRIGLPAGGDWRVLLNSDAEEFGGSAAGPSGALQAEAVESHGREHSLELTLPPLGILFLGRARC